MTRNGSALAAAAALALLAAAPPIGDLERVRWLGETRHIAVYSPATAASGAPLLLAVGDPGRSARYALDSWRELAEVEGFVVAAISSHDARMWNVPQDGPGFLRAVVQRLKTSRRIDPRRIYLFGGDAGGAFALWMAALQPQYFAAIASCGGVLPAENLGQPDLAGRALPVRIYYPKQMPQFDVDDLRHAASVLREAGADVEMTKVDLAARFERKGEKVAARIWAALAPHALTEGPRYRTTPFD